MAHANQVRRAVPAGFVGALGVAILCALIAQPQLRAGQDQRRPPGVDRGPNYVEREVLVRFRRGAAASDRATAHLQVRSQRLRTFAGIGDLELVRLPSDVTVRTAVDSYRRHPDVLYAEPNYLLQATAIPNDPQFSSLWALKNTGQTFGRPGADINATEAWNITTGSSSVVVAVIDSGIDYTHPDLAANMFRNEADCNTDGIDNDGNGYVDDCYGIDAYNNDADPRDDHQHGTHVAGIIGAVGHNNIGVAGVNWRVRLMPCKFLNSSGSGSTSGAIACLDYVKTMKDRGVNIVATNNSWGGSDYSRALADAIDAQRRSGILFITAAGNSSLDTDTLSAYPSGYYFPNVLSIAATTASDSLALFSNFGRRTVHLGAPGQSIVSTVPNNSYATLSGTSMAAPHVTGVAALLKAQDPTRDWRAIKNLLLAGGDDVPALAATITGKRLNAYGALTCRDTTLLAPLQPFGATGTVGTPVSLAALHINCGKPGGIVTVTVQPDGAVVTLSDDGAGSDQAADDGIYSGQWTPVRPGTFTFTFPNGDTTDFVVLDNYSPSPVLYNYRTIAGTNLNLDADTTGTITPPFPVLFGGHPFSTLFVSGNGNVSVSAAFIGDINNQLLPTGRIDTLLAPFWDHLLPVSHTEQNVFWAVTGTAPHRELVIEWRSLAGYRSGSQSCPGSTVTFELVLFEGTSDVLFNYADTMFGSTCSFADRGRSATSGLQVTRTLAFPYGFNIGNLDPGTSVLWTTHAQAPTVTWPPPAAIVYGTVLGPAQLNAAANVDGTFFYVPPAGTLLGAGAAQPLSAIFTPSDGAGYISATSVVTIDVLKATPIVSWKAPAAISVGTPLGGPQLNATASVPGTFAYSPPSGTVLPAGASQTLSAIFTPSDAANYQSVSTAVTIDVKAGTIGVTSPNGNGSWRIGSTQTISFTHALGAGQAIALDLSRDGGASWEPITTVATTLAMSGGYAWVVTGPATTHARIRARSADDSTQFDISDVDFVIAEPAVSVTSPNGSGVIQIGNAQTILFTHNLDAGQVVNLDLSRDGGGTWSPLAAVTTTAAASASYPWLVSGPATSRARIRARWAADPSVVDVSDVDFTILDRITVTSPNGSGSLRAGATHVISFTHTLGAGQPVRLDVSRDGGTTWSPIMTLITSNAVSGSYPWVVSGPPTTQARVRASKTGDAAVFDVSDVNFTIENPVTVTAPNTHVSWLVGSAHPIAWAHGLSAGEAVNIDVSRDGGVTWSAVAAGVPSGAAGAGSYAWTVSGPASTHARIRVSRAADPSTADASDADFTVAQPTLAVTSPNGSGAVLVGSVRPITFTHTLGVGQPVAIEVSRDGGLTWTAVTTLTTTAPTSGSFSWIVTGPPSTQSRIRASWIADPAVADMSDVNFTIQ